MVLKVGLCIAIEPMLNAGASRCVLDDDWTVVTQDGSLSAHWEDTIAITKDGPMVLTRV
jgi:methionyl aminopeptidase